MDLNFILKQIHTVPPIHQQNIARETVQRCLLANLADPIRGIHRRHGTTALAQHAKILRRLRLHRL